MNRSHYTYPATGTPRGYRPAMLERRPREDTEGYIERADAKWGEGNWMRQKRYHARYWLFWVRSDLRRG